MPVFEYSRKVQTLGSSLALTIPSLFVKVMEIKKGDALDVIHSLDGVLVVSNSKDVGSLRECLMMLLDMLEDKVGDKD